MVVKILVSHRHSALRLAYRYASGRPIDAIARTDSTWAHRGTTALTKSGRASRWAMMSGRARQAVRLGVPIAITGVAAAGAEAPIWTEASLAAVATAGAAYGTRTVIRRARGRKYTRTVVRPLIAALAPIVEMSAPDIAERLTVPAPNATGDAERIAVPLPDHWAGKTAQVADISRIVQQRLGGEWDSSLNLRQHPYYLNFTPRPAPPGKVTFDMVRDAVLATSQDKPVLGLGARSETLHLDFTGEIAHLAASVGTGGGKSSFLRFLIAQFAHHGVRNFLVADVKWVSLQGMEDVPGLHVYRDVEDIWAALAAEREEMDRRYSMMLANPGIVFPRRVIVLEEQNSFALETAIRWREVRPKGDKRAMAPVWNDIALMLLKYRQVNGNVIGVYQRMSADAAGGGSLRDQYGLKLLSRFSSQAWDTLVGTRPRGVSSAVPGRAIAVLGGQQRAVQLPLVSVAEAMELATSGAPVTVVETDTKHEAGAPAQRDVTTLAVPRYSLVEAAKTDWCPISYAALRQRASRGRAAGTWPTGRTENRQERWTREELLAAIAASKPLTLVVDQDDDADAPAA